MKSSVTFSLFVRYGQRGIAAPVHAIIKANNIADNSSHSGLTALSCLSALAFAEEVSRSSPKGRPLEESSQADGNQTSHQPILRAEQEACPASYISTYC